MSDDASPRLGLPYLAAAQAQKHVTMNAALALLDGLVASAVESRTVAAQPASPVDGALHLLPASASGAAWAGKAAGTLMRFEAGAWTVEPQPPGLMLLVKDEGRIVVRAATARAELGALLGQLATLGIGTAADASNPLAVRGPAALFTHAGAGVQLKLNKATAADTASLLFQTAFGGRAEVGLAGDDKLHVKVSPDGAAWTEALVVDGQGRIAAGASFRAKSFAKAALPSAATEGAGALVYVSDDAAGATLAFSDGSAWRRVHDRAVVA